MERLTIRNSDGSVSQPTNTSYADVFMKLAAYEDIGSPEEFRAYKDTGLTPEEIKSGITDPIDLARIAVALRKLRRYEYAEQSGRRVVLPVKVGDKLFALFQGYIEPITVMRVRQYIMTDLVSFFPEDIGITVFRTREEAEHVLEVSGK